jgi:hypothetical protein
MDRDMDDAPAPNRTDDTPGPLAEDKIESASPPPGQPRVQPDTMEVESARLLANTARDALRADGLDDEEIGRLADEYIALDLGEDERAFIAWAREHART